MGYQPFGHHVARAEGASAFLAADGYPVVMLAEDLARLLRVHRDTLYDWIKAGKVPKYRRVGTGPKARYEWLRFDVERWLVNRPATTEGRR